MSEELLTPTDYQAQRIALARETGIRMPSVEQAVLNSSSSMEKIKMFSLAWAEDFLREYDMRDWNIDEDIKIVESFEGYSLVAQILLHDPENRPFGKAVYAQSKGPVQRISIDALSPMRDDHDRTPQMRGGMLSVRYGSDPQTGYRNAEADPGVLVLYKSWEIEALDGMGIELPWDPPEDHDREPVEE